MNNGKKSKEEIMKAMFGAQSPWHCPEFPLVLPEKHHVVTYEVHKGDEPFKPRTGKDMWDLDHVKMPCSDKNLDDDEDFRNSTDNVNFFPHCLICGEVGKKWDLIVKALSKPMHSAQDILDAVLTYQQDFEDFWEFKGLKMFLNVYLGESERNKFFDKTLPAVAKLALALPRVIKSPIPLLKKGQNKAISFTQLQLASLLANAFFCTFPKRNEVGRYSEYNTYPTVNFNTLYNSVGPVVMEKLKCICHYFTRVSEEQPQGVVTFSRRHVPVESCPDWTNCSLMISNVPFYVDCDKYIEDAEGCIQVDFANEYIGGGVLRGGAVQEEIRFVCNPELIASTLFCEAMDPTETIMIIGSERFSCYSGYNTSFKWAGDYRDGTPRDSSNRRRRAVLAMDARWFPDPRKQYSKKMVDRELNKTYVGFSFYGGERGLNYPGVATGNWGCGAFGGNANLKAMLQLLAAVLANRPIAYYTFGNEEFGHDLNKIYSMLLEYNVTVGELYKYIIDFCESDVPKTNLYGYLGDLIIQRTSNS